MVRVFLIALLLAACTTHEVRYVPEPCPGFTRPELPVIDPIPKCSNRLIVISDWKEIEPGALLITENECLTDESWFRWERRDQMRKQYAEKYEDYCATLKHLEDRAND